MTSAVVTMVLAVGGQALAHAVIVDSTPSPYAHVQAGHLAIALRYNSRIDAARSKLLLGPRGALQRLKASQAASPDTLQAATEIAPGDYEIRWQVLATDGHVTRGRIPFTVDAPHVAGAAQ